MIKKLTYAEQLKHPQWQRKRLEILNRDNFVCQVCYASNSTLHVHHKHYLKGRMAWEYSNYELVTLCEFCHETAQEQIDSFKTLWASLRVDGPFSTGDATGLIAGWANNNSGVDLSEYKSESPHSFVLGEVAQAIDWADLTHEELIDLRDALLSIGTDRRKVVIWEMVATLTSSTHTA